jgi:hypothetical protein
MAEQLYRGGKTARDAPAGPSRQRAGASVLPDRRVRAAPQAAAGSPVAQLQIAEKYTSWLGARAPSRHLTANYLALYEVGRQKGLANQYGVHDKDQRKVNGAYDYFMTKFDAQAGAEPPNNDYAWTAKALDTLVTYVNQAQDNIPSLSELRGQRSLARAHLAANGVVGAAAPALPPHIQSNAALHSGLTTEAALDGYGHGDATNWNDVHSSLAALRGMVAPHVAPKAAREGAMPGIPVIPFSAAQAQLPPSLFRQIRDIHAGWKTGAVMDRRTPSEIAGKALTSNQKGGLRSWHMNTRGALPAAGGAAVATPDYARGLETHYHQTSKTMHHLGAAPAGPDGYAEYTGTGMRDDNHNSKIVLDYKRGGIYLTVTHYQLWNRAEDSPNEQNTAMGQNADNGSQSAWFFIDMNS